MELTGTESACLLRYMELSGAGRVICFTARGKRAVFRDIPSGRRLPCAEAMGRIAMSVSYPLPKCLEPMDAAGLECLSGLFSRCGLENAAWALAECARER